jgi:lipopolysaccharide exporter
VLRKLQQFSSRSEFLTNAFKLIGGTAVGQLLTLLVSPVLSRLYSPADFGTFALYTTIISLMMVVGAFRYDLAIVMARNRREALHVLGLAFLFLVGVSLVSLVVVLGLQGPIGAYMDLGHAGWLVFLLPLAILSAGGYQNLSHWANRAKDYRALAFSRIAQSSTSAGVAVLVGLLFSTGMGLILGHLSGSLVGFGLIARQSAAVLRKAPQQISSRRLRHTLVKFRDFPLYSLPNAFLNNLSLNLPVFLISSFFTGPLTGQYSLAVRVLNIPMAVIGAGIGQVFYQKLSDTYHRKGDCRRLVTQTWSSLFVVGVGPMVLVLLFGPHLFRLVFGPEWTGAGEMAAILALPLFISFCSAPTSIAFTVFRIQHLSFIFGFLSVLLRPLAFYLGYRQADLYLSLRLWAVVEIGLTGAYNVIVYRKSGQAR